MKRRLISALTGMFLTVLSGDLLYLYFVGAWTDTMIIVVAEIIVLCILVLWGIFYCAYHLREIK